MRSRMGAPDHPQARRVGRPPLPEEAVEARVAEYCRRYGVERTVDGLPPFPSGQRETAQHREWLVVYRAVKRLAARRAPIATKRPRAVQGALACAVCDRPIPPSDEPRELRLARSRVRVHLACAELAARAREAGPESLVRVLALLWPQRS
jgi:hypothetical protein